MVEGDLGRAALAAVLAAGMVAVAAGPLLRRLPEPSDPAGKPAYASLATPGFVAGCALAAAVAAAVSWLLLPAAVQPLWTVTGTLGVLLAAIDARTTWLPLALTRVAWVAMVLATGLAAALADDLALLVRAGVGAAVAGGLFGLVWVLSRGGFGFGDVRFVPLLGAASAAVSTTHLVVTLLLGSLLGAGYGLARLAVGRRTGFPYAPPLLLGAYLGVATLAVG